VTSARGDALQVGEILVARETDPGWVTIFPLAAGILIERGSPLSHSAIVARELGIPTIVGVRGLTSVLSTGAVVEMDGGTGQIARIG
jgi:pyruvate,water dikinase